MNLSGIGTISIILVCLMSLIPALLGYRRSRHLARPSTQAQRLQLRDTIALDPRRRVHLVACDGRLVLLLTGGSQDIVVGWLSE